MTGDAPQPGETPRSEGNPWARDDPGAGWWRGRDEPPGEAAGARAAGALDVNLALTADTPQLGTAVFQPVPRSETPAPAPATAKTVERRHDQVDAERFNTAGDGTTYVPRTEQAVPEVMLLPEPERDRPTVALERAAVPGQPPTGQPRQALTHQDRVREDPVRADRALQDRVRQERTATLLETSSFWAAAEQRESRERPAAGGRPPRRRPRQPRRPAGGLAGLVALGLVAAFFSWVSAEPFWLAVGHGDRGSATVGRCTGAGVTQRCAGQFLAADGAYRVDNLALLGVEPGQRGSGAVTHARMVSSESRQAYVGHTGVLVHLRWALGFVLVLLCGLGIAGLTGARRLETRRARRGALLLSLAGPLALLAGFLAVAY
jgi:hypothetical protein